MLGSGTGDAVRRTVQPPEYKLKLSHARAVVLVRYATVYKNVYDPHKEMIFAAFIWQLI